MGKKVLIAGNGGREHALGWSISQNEEVDEVIYAKGNPGTERDPKSRNVDIDAIKKDNFPKLADLVEKEDISMIVVGPEQPLVDGITDFFNKRGYNRVFGPTSKGADIEADKYFSSDIMTLAGVPQAQSIKLSGVDNVITFLNDFPKGDGIVIKARGLTGGKGVFVYDNKQHALSRIKEDMSSLTSLDVLAAERLEGHEFSVFGISDGNKVVPLEMSVQDHKRLLNNDKGPNTGGMGAYGPVPFANRDMVRYVADNMMTPVVREMKKQGIEYKGFLYAGVMMTKNGPKILEFNCRFGDPEAEPSVMMLKNGLYQPVLAALDGRMDDVNFEFKPGAAYTVVMAANGYPDSKKIQKGFPIGGLEEVAKLKGVKVFHAGTAKDEDGRIVASGGRVLMVTAYSSNWHLPTDLTHARNLAYHAVNIIDQETQVLNNMQMFIYRRDIGANAFQR